MANEVSVYGKIADPPTAVKDMGNAIARCGMFGCVNESQGQVFAWTCLCEGKTPIEVAARYHLITTPGGGTKLSRKAESLLADYMNAGGKWKWLETTEKVARAHVEYGENKLDVSYTIEEAAKAGYVKTGSNWVKIPATMLRWRLVANTVRMIAPSISMGLYTPEEIQDTVTVTEYEVKPVPAAPLFAKPETAPEPAPPAAEPEKATPPAAAWGLSDFRELIAKQDGITEADATAYLVSIHWLDAGQGIDALNEARLGKIAMATSLSPDKFFGKVREFLKVAAQSQAVTNG